MKCTMKFHDYDGGSHNFPTVETYDGMWPVPRVGESVVKIDGSLTTVQEVEYDYHNVLKGYIEVTVYVKEKQ